MVATFFYRLVIRGKVRIVAHSGGCVFLSDWKEGRCFRSLSFVLGVYFHEQTVLAFSTAILRECGKSEGYGYDKERHKIPKNTF